jgi:hypothetical protein
MSADQSTTPVEYRQITRFIGYRFGSDGSVWTCWKRSGRPKGAGNGALWIVGTAWNLMSPVPHHDGRLFVGIKDATMGRKTIASVSRLILEAFVGPCPRGMQACHFPDPDVTNNRVENLRWGTAKDNAKHRDIHGNTRRGEANSRAKLTWDKVDQIRAALGRGETHSSLGKRFGVDPTQIANIAHGRAWSRR